MSSASEAPQPGDVNPHQRVQGDLDTESGGMSIESAASTARPEVANVEAFRKENWGKRDGWAWLYGIAAPLQFIQGLLMVKSSLMQEGADKMGVVLLFGLFTLGSAAVCALFWMGKPIARPGVMMMMLLTLGVGGPGWLRLVEWCFGQVDWWFGWIGRAVVIALMAESLRSPRNKLFFKDEIARS